MALGEVGKVGVAIDSLADMETPLRRHPARQGLHLDDHQLHRRHPALRSTSPWPRSRASPPDKLSGTIQNDILKEYIARGTYIYPAQATPCASSPTSSPTASDTRPQVEHHLHLRLPHPRGRLHRRAGSRLHPRRRHRLRRSRHRRRPRRRRLRPAPRFFFNAHNNFFEEVAKFRAARRLWAKIMKDALRRQRPALPDAPLPHPDRRLHPHRPAARQQHRARHHPGPGRRPRRHPVAPHQLLWTKPWPCPPRTPSRIALRTQQVIAYETGVADTIDPVAGSYLVEAPHRPKSNRPPLTTFQRSTAWAACCAPSKRGSSSSEIQNAAYDYQRAIETEDANHRRRQQIHRQEARTIPTLRIEPELEQRQVERLRALRAKRSRQRWQQGIDAEKKSARNGGNLMPAIFGGRKK